MEPWQFELLNQTNQTQTQTDLTSWFTWLTDVKGASRNKCVMCRHFVDEKNEILYTTFLKPEKLKNEVLEIGEISKWMKKNNADRKSVV